NVLPRAMPLRLGLGQQVAGLGAPVPARLLAREPLLGLGLGVCCLAVLAWRLLAVLPPPAGRSKAFTPTSPPVSHPSGARGGGGTWAGRQRGRHPRQRGLGCLSGVSWHPPGGGVPTDEHDVPSGPAPRRRAPAVLRCRTPWRCMRARAGAPERAGILGA